MNLPIKLINVSLKEYGSYALEVYQVPQIGEVKNSFEKFIKELKGKLKISSIPLHVPLL